MLAGFVLIATLVNASAGRQPCRGPAGSDSQAWRVASNDTFEIRIPPGYKERAIRGVDSFIGQWVRGRSNLSFNYGMRYASVLLRSAQAAGGSAGAVLIEIRG